MAWSHVICESLTGKRLLTVYPGGWSWTTGKNTNIGSGDAQFKIWGSGLSASTWRDLVQPWSRTLVTCWDGDPVHAGLVMGHTYNRKTSMLTVEHSEFRTVLSRRTVASGVAYAADGAFEVTGKSKRGLARAVISRYATNVTPGFGFPLVLPADEAGGESRRWPFYEFATAEDMLSEIQNADGGPDVYFRPRWSPTTGNLEWVVDIGAPGLSGPTVEWVLDAPNSPAMDVMQRTDGTKTLTGIIALGKGSEQDMVIGFAGGLGNFPVWLDVTKSHKSIDDASRLDALALGELRSVDKPTVQLTIGSALAAVALPDVRVGSTIRLLSSRDPFIADGTHPLNVIGMSGGPGETVSLETQ